MNLPELKEDFYKRFDPSDNFLHFTSNGLLCDLLGHSSVEYAPSLTCALSMRVKMFARRLGSDMVNIQDVSSAQAFSYTFGTPSELLRGENEQTAKLINRLMRYNINGAQILYECSIPEFLSKKEVFAVTLAQSVMKVSGAEADMLETAAMAGGGEHMNQYIGILAAKKGFCSLISSGEPKNLPLPLSGYKLLSAHCTEKEKDRSEPINKIFEQIRRLYPHVGSIADITPEMFNAVSAYIKDKTALRYMYHLVNENARIKSAAKALKRCDIKTLFREMKLSQKSMERFWNIGSEHILLADCCRGVDGVAAVRTWKNGVIMVVEDDKIDYAVKMIRGSFENNVGYRPTFCVSEAY